MNKPPYLPNPQQALVAVSKPAHIILGFMSSRYSLSKILKITHGGFLTDHSAGGS